MGEGIVVVFDLDGTLLNGDSEMLWSHFLLERGVVDADYDRKITAFYRDYENGRLDFETYEEHLLHPLRVTAPEVILGERSQYLDRIRAALRPKMLERIEWHRGQRHRILLLTATNDFLAVPIAALLHIQDLICTRAETEGHSFTGKIAGVPAFREGKITHLKSWLAVNALALENSWAYSDSHNDLELLGSVDHPVAVTPDRKLRRHAREHRWEIMDMC